MSSSNMRRRFADREEMIRYLREQFPAAAAISPSVSEINGGREAAEEALVRIDPAAYARTRNHLEGSVTRLSPYIRYGVLSLEEVKREALQKVSAAGEATRLIQELAWRDYYQRLYRALGDGIWEDIEPYKTGFDAGEYAHDIPADVWEGRTGTCLDRFIAQLYETGYLHNRARLWLAAYLVHWRRVRWQAGAAWFLIHLLDGDPASNNLSWQWVASTFSHKPYYFNLDNLKKFGADVAGYDNTPFAGSYEEIAQRLFPRKPAGAAW